MGRQIVLPSIAFILFAINYISSLITGENFGESAIYQLYVGFQALSISIIIYPLALSFLFFIALALIVFCSHRIPVVRNMSRTQWIAINIITLFYVIFNPVTQQISHAIISPYRHEDQAEFKDNYRSIKGALNSRKNVVYIYLESLERTFFDESLFPNLTPNLTALEGEADHYTEIGGLSGTDWTMAAMVASQCGIPLVTPLGSGNSMGRVGSFLPGAQCLGDILHSSGYYLEYIGGAPKEFAGKDKFYQSHGFDAVRGLQDAIRDGEVRSEWGRYDDALLNDVTKRYQELVETSQPFALIALTLDTHAPTGFTSPACGDLVYGDGSNKMLNAVHCSDKVIGQFIRKIRSLPGADQTLFFVGSDHLSMRNTATEYLVHGKRRNFLMVFDGLKKDGQKIDKRGATIDIGATMLDYLSDGRINALGLGRSLRNEKIDTLVNSFGDTTEVNAKLEAWRSSLLDLWNFATSVKRGFNLDEEGRLTIGQAEFHVPINLELKSDEIRSVFLDEILQTFFSVRRKGGDSLLIDSCRSLSLAGVKVEASHPFCYLYTVHNKGTFVGDIDTTRSVSLSELKNGRRLESDEENKVFVAASTGTQPEYVHIAGILSEWGGDIRITSAGFGSTIVSVVKSRTNKIDTPLHRGLNLISVRADGSLKLEGTIDPCAASEEKEETLESLMDWWTDQYIVVGSDSIYCESKTPLQQAFKGTGLTKWAEVAVRAPYIAILDGNRSYEFVGEAGKQLTVWDPTPGTSEH